MARFTEITLGAKDMPALIAHAGGNPRTVAELMNVVHQLHGAPAGSVSSIDSLLSSAAQKNPSLKRDAVEALAGVCIGTVDDELQQIYRAHLETRPLDALRHDDRVALLGDVRGDAVRVVAAKDWEWLAAWLRLPAAGARDCLWRLSNFAFRCDRVNFRMTYHCNIECRHCYNSSGPNAKAHRIPLDAMLRIIGEMPAAGIRALNITGGEPFLYLDDVVAMIRAARSAGVRKITIYTNGFWGRTASQASAVLDRLADAGFGAPADHIRVSGGLYHEEFIPFDCLAVLVTSYYERFRRRLHMEFETAEGEGPDEEEIAARITRRGLTDKALVLFRRTHPMGRGHNLAAPLSSGNQPCHIIDQIAFDPDGVVRPCCGFNNENQGVRIGSVDEPLPVVIKRMQNDPLLQFLATNPMGRLFQQVGKRPNLLGYGSDCALCQDAIGNLTDKNDVQARLFRGQKFYPFWFTPQDLVATG